MQSLALEPKSWIYQLKTTRVGMTACAEFVASDFRMVETLRARRLEWFVKSLAIERNCGSRAFDTFACWRLVFGCVRCNSLELE